MFRKRPRRPKRPRVYRIPVESDLSTLAVVFALSVAISLLNQPKKISHLPRHEFSVRGPAFVPSAHALANPLPVTGNRVDLGDRIFPAMLAAIDAAKATVNLESSILWSGEIASRFRDALAAAARRGVEVRVLLDGVGSAGKVSESDLGIMRRAGCVIEFYHAARPWMLDVVNNRTLEESFWDDLKYSRPYTYREVDGPVVGGTVSRVGNRPLPLAALAGLPD